MTAHPLINHITFIGPSGKWISRGFLPLYDHILKWAEDMKCPDNCRLAPHCHPMVEDDKHGYHKLCTLTVIKAGLVKEKEII